MKIISKFKDYYDWVIFETDNRKTYIRNRLEVVWNQNIKSFDPDKHAIWPLDSHLEPKCEYHPDYEINSHIGFIFFCDRIFSYLFFEGKYFWKYSDIPKEVLAKIKPKDKKYPSWRNNHSHLSKLINQKQLGIVYEPKKWSEPDDQPRIHAKTDFNRKIGFPVIGIMNENRIGKTIFNPNLGDIDFNRMIDPNQAYQEIYNWIEYKEPEVPSSPNDMSRYEAKGFDKKTSFRPKMK